MVLRNIWAKRAPIFWPVSLDVLECIPPGETLTVRDLSATQRTVLKVFIDAGLIAIAPDPLTVH
jgi:hypothetical protein